MRFLAEHCNPSSKTFHLFHEEYERKKLAKSIDSRVKTITNSAVFNFTVNVLLDEHITTTTKVWHFLSDKPFVVYTLDNLPKRLCCSTSSLDVGFSEHHFMIKSKKISSKKGFFIVPKESLISIDNATYHGAFVLTQYKDQVLLINQVDIEDYIYSVLRWESWPGWPLEVNKAFAIASRTYLMARVLEARSLKRLYHVKKTNIHQTYKGTHSNAIIKQAIEATKGQILTYEKKPIDAMFDSCCGGIIPAHVSYVDFQKAPYLARTYQCTYCKNYKIYSWSSEFSAAEMCSIFQNAGYPCTMIKAITIIERDLAGTVTKIMVKTDRQELVFSGREFYALFDVIKSYYYHIETTKDGFKIHGRGYGHLVGICQWGARKMVDEGWTFKSILAYYYPGAVLMELRQSAH